MTLAAWLGHTDVVVELVKAEANLDLQNEVYTSLVLHTPFILFDVIFTVILRMETQLSSELQPDMNQTL